MTENEYYVYLYLREDGTPYYVGKGKGNRAFIKKGRSVSLPLDKNKIVFHSENLTEDKAFALEKELIEKYGRKDNDTGILRNLTDGGEGVSGRIFSEEARKRASEQTKAWSKNNPEARKKASEKVREFFKNPENRKKHSEKAKEYFKNPENRKKQSEKVKEYFKNPENRKKVSEKRKQYYENPENIKKLSERGKEYFKNPENRKKVSEKRKQYYENPENRKKHSERVSRPEVGAKKSAAMHKYFARKRAEKLQESANLTEFFISDPVSD
jgi:NifU-like protein involved in Fe-S cluster formation